MWYLFDDKQQCCGTISGEPNHEDLASRGEFVIKSDLILPLDGILLFDGAVTRRATTLNELKLAKLHEVDTWTATAITSGFMSAATGTVATYGSTKEDQQNIMLMLQAAQSADFVTHPIYQGHIPIRAVPKGQTDKVILQHDADQMQELVNDMALHIGACKQIGWQLQGGVAAAETAEELVEIKWP